MGIIHIKKIIGKIPGVKTCYHLIYYNVFKRYRRVYVSPLNTSALSDEFEKTKLIESIETQCYSPESDQMTGQKTGKVVLGPVYRINLKKATVIGGSNIILKDNRAFYNHNIGENVNYSDNAFHDYSETYKLGRNKIYLSSMQRIKIENGISFCINYNFNYYHFVLECLSKFQLLEMSDIDISWPIIIDKTARDIPQFQELLGIFNKTKRKIIYVDRLQQVEVEDLFIFTPIHYLPANYLDIYSISCKDVAFNRSNILFLRKTIMDSIGADLTEHPCHNKIFISRHNFKRRSYNNDEIQASLEAYGYATVYPEKLTFTEQVKVFHNAECIIAASGAALTNIIFCRPKTKIYVLTNVYLDLSIFSTIAKYLDLDMTYIIADSTESKELHSSFHIDANNLSSLLKANQTNI